MSTKHFTDYELHLEYSTAVFIADLQQKLFASAGIHCQADQRERWIRRIAELRMKEGAFYVECVRRAHEGR